MAAKKRKPSKSHNTSPEDARVGDSRAPSMDEWAALFDAAARFKEAEPWNDFYDSYLFGVMNPETGVVGYCSIMGMAGEHFALGVYPGREGLASFELLADVGARGHLLETKVAGNLQKCLMVSFEDRSELNGRDFKLIKALGLKFRGRNAWPLFRRHDPGYFPDHLNADDVRFLTVALEQALYVAQRFREDEDYLFGPVRDARMLIRWRQSGESAEWGDLVQRVESSHRISLAWSEEVINAVACLPVRPGFVLDLPVSVFPGGVKEENGERYSLPFLIIFVDAASQMVLGFEMMTPEEFPQKVLMYTANKLLALGVRPTEIRMSDRYVFPLVAPMVDGCDTAINLYESLQQSEKLIELLNEQFGAGPTIVS